MRRILPIQKPKMSASEYEAWRDLIEERCGLYFGDSRIRYLSQCLWERMRRQDCQSYGDYYRTVAPRVTEEWRALLELLLTHETSFFRHPPSFEALGAKVLPELLRDRLRAGANELRLWSAGCSTGEEAYSLAMVALETAESFDIVARREPAPSRSTASWTRSVAGRSVDPAPQPWRIEVSGTDLSEKAVEKAREGRYRLRRTRPMPEAYSKKYTTRLQDGRDPLICVKEDVRSLVQFFKASLMEPDAWPRESQDIIFCQNVLIYFRPEGRLPVVQGLCERLATGGSLFLGPAEMIGLKIPGIRPLALQEVLVYQKHPN